MNQIPLFLVTGFLGSGKTTFLKRILNQYADSYRLAVIQNEFAPGNADGKELRQTGKTFQMLEINRGSVFCVCLLSDFTRSLKQLAETYQPDAVFLEATGLADPIAIAEMMTSPDISQCMYLKEIWCVVDASTFLQMEASFNRIQHQVRIADTVLLNKVDLADELVPKVTSRIYALNPFAKIIETRYCETDIDHIFDASQSSPVALEQREKNADFESSGRPSIQSAVIKTTRKVSSNDWEAFIKRLPASILRIKGYVQLDNQKTINIQGCFGDIQSREMDEYHGPTELIVLGDDFDARQLRETFFQSQI